jgi:Zn-dependent protease with chaperone function
VTGYVLRRSALSLGLLTALLAAAGALLVLWGAPVWLPFLLAGVVVTTQWALSPYLLQWLIPATELARRDDGYDTTRLPSAERLAGIVAHRCREAGVAPVRLGVVDDGTPNAFTFGHTRGNARIYVTRGLLERLDERELDAVVSHEVGHVRQNDVLVMAIAATVPLVLYYAFLALRDSRNQSTVVPAIVAYVGFLLSQLVVLALSRARELAADHHSCRVTGDGDALCSALVKVGYGMGQEDAERAARAAAARAGKDKDARRAAAKEERHAHRLRAAGVLGIADQRQGATVLAAAERGLEAREVVGALRWDTCNPWARFTQLFSTHPLVVRRIAALEDSGLPGAPRQWSAREVEASCEGADLARARRRFLPELLVRYAPVAALVVGLVAWSQDAYLLLAQAATALGVALLLRTSLQRPLRPAVPVPRVAELLPRLDAGPVRGLPVEVRGRVIGRGTPGYVLSPDLVVQDGSGFVPVLYQQPWPFARSLFGLLRAPDLLDQEVTVCGWYRRNPAPVLELRRLVPAEGRAVRGFGWVAAYVLAVVLSAGGGAAWALLTLAS